MHTSLSLPETGYLRLPAVLRFVPVSRSTWWAGVRAGRYPQPSRALGRRITAWRAEDIRALIESAAPTKEAA
jgi:predicted DNA-binding transcriptional regulator AlpA